jgi:hypothetical protein
MGESERPSCFCVEPRDATRRDHDTVHCPKATAQLFVGVYSAGTSGNFQWQNDFFGVQLMIRFLLLFPAALAACLMFAGAATATTYISDDFSTYANGNLIGVPNAAGGWVQTAVQSTLPIQVSGGKVVLPAPQTGNNQDAFKTLGTVITSPASGATSVFVGLSLKVNSAPVINSSPFTSSSYFLALDNALDGSGFDNERVAAIDNSANVPGTYLLQARVTGQAGSPFVTGSTPLLYGATYNFVMEASLTSVGSDEAVKLFIDPTNGNLGEQTPYLISPIAGGTPLTGIGGVILSQFASASTGNSGLEIGSLRIADTFAEASALVVPEPSSFVLAGMATAVLFGLRVRRKS